MSLSSATIIQYALCFQYFMKIRLVLPLQAIVDIILGITVLQFKTRD